MRVRLVGVLVAVAALCAVLSAAAAAQTGTPTGTATATATPTPTPTATPTPEPTPTPEEERQARLRKRKIVKRVYRDYEADGRVDACKHSRTALKRTLQSISDEYEVDFPDFREIVRAALKNYRKANERCAREKAAAEATPTPTASPTPAPTAAPTTTPPSTDSGTAPPLDLGGGGGGRGHQGGALPRPKQTKPPSEGDVSPVQPSPTPSPTAVAPRGPAETQLVVTRPGDRGSLLVPALLLAAALIGLALTGASALAARRGGRLAGWGHAWREAGYRATGAWGDFGDWLRLGR